MTTTSSSTRIAPRFTRRDGTLTTTLEVIVSAEDDAEVRRVSITNTGSRSREIEITSYAELVLAPQSADIAHPAFSKLFVETEYLARRRRDCGDPPQRSPGEPEIWAAHLAVVDGEAVGDPEFETDRARFLGRGHAVRAPIAMIGRPAALQHGRHRARSDLLAPPAHPHCAGRDRARRLLDDGRRDADRRCSIASTSTTIATAFTRASTLAWTQAQVQLHHLGVDCR